MHTHPAPATESFHRGAAKPRVGEHLGRVLRIRCRSTAPRLRSWARAPQVPGHL